MDGIDAKSSAIDRALVFGRRHKRALTVAGWTWFAFCCAVYARFIDLPDLTARQDAILFWTGCGWTVFWHAIALPRLTARTATLDEQLPHSGAD